MRIPAAAVESEFYLLTVDLLLMEEARHWKALHYFSFFANMDDQGKTTILIVRKFYWIANIYLVT